jgi:hypothetical protein
MDSDDAEKIINALELLREQVKRIALALELRALDAFRVACDGHVRRSCDQCESLLVASDKKNRWRCAVCLWEGDDT